MMIEPPIDKLLDISNDRYTLVMMASKRARQITAGSVSRTENESEHKSISTAIYEIYENKIGYVRRKEGIK